MPNLAGLALVVMATDLFLAQAGRPADRRLIVSGLVALVVMVTGWRNAAPRRKLV